MFRCACVLLALSICTSPTFARIGSSSTRYSHPLHRGISGGGNGSEAHSLATSDLSDSSSSHRYPGTSRLSGLTQIYSRSVRKSGSGSRHGHRSHSGGISQSGHTYPISEGLSGQVSKYPKHPDQKHVYPESPGLAGHTPHTPRPEVTTHVHHQYPYSPPREIHYSSPGLAPMHYPVYRGPPPTYLYEYRDSESKFSNLLVGLTLYNLGELTTSKHSHHRSSSSYKPKPGEICKFGIRKDNGDYEETRIKCDIINSFIWAEEAKAQSATTGGTNSTVTNVTSTTTNVNAMPVPTLTQINQTMLPNGTLVPTNINVTAASITTLSNGISSTITTSNVNTMPVPIVTQINQTMLPNGTLVPTNINVTAVNNITPLNGISSTITTSTNTTEVADALDPKNKGPSMKLTSGMQCYVIRTTPTSNFKKTVPCGLLQFYAEKSFPK